MCSLKKQEAVIPVLNPCTSECIALPTSDIYFDHEIDANRRNDVYIIMTALGNSFRC